MQTKRCSGISMRHMVAAGPLAERGTVTCSSRPASAQDSRRARALGRVPGTVWRSHRVLVGGVMSGSVIVAGARTPIGRLLGGLKDQSAADLGGVAIKAALEKAGVSGDQVDYLIMGQVILAGAGQNPARSAGIAAGLPMSMPSI